MGSRLVPRPHFFFHLAASTQNQALAALTFLYDAVLGSPLERVEGIAPARRSRRVPVVLSQREVRALLGQLRDPLRLCAAIMYGSGLRITECLSLRVKDVDLDRLEIVVRDGKGGKDRRATLAAAFLRHAAAGGGRRHPDGAGAARAHRRADDDDLHARAQLRRVGSAKSGGSVVGRGADKSARRRERRAMGRGRLISRDLTVPENMRRDGAA
jgi:integrase